MPTTVRPGELKTRRACENFSQALRVFHLLSRTGPLSASGVFLGAPFAVGNVQIQVVTSHAAGEKIGEDSHRVVFAENEIEEAEQTSGHAEDPEQSGNHRSARPLGGPQLQKPARSEEENAYISNQLPGGNADSE